MRTDHVTAQSTHLDTAPEKIRSIILLEMAAKSKSVSPTPTETEGFITWIAMFP